MAYKVDTLKDLREAHNLSQQELADETGIPKSRIAKWEQGKGSPKADDTETLKKFFGEHVPREKEISLKTLARDIATWQAEVNSSLSVLMSELVPLLAKHHSKSISAAASQMKKDIETEKKLLLEALSKKPGF